MGETIRVQHSKNYTVIANAAIRDSRLSFKARGLHHLLLSYPDGWKVSIEHLSTQSEMDGETAVRTGLQELERLGYLTREQVREKGKIVGYESTIREVPSENPPAPKNRRSKPQVDFPQVDFPQVDFPQADFPQADFPQAENSVHNKYLFQEVFKKEISKESTEEDLSGQELTGQELTPNHSKTSDLKGSLSHNPISPLEGQFAPAAPARLDKANITEPFGKTRKTAKEIAWEWLPDGPWKKHGQLDNEFWQWLALQWMSQFGTDIHQARANVYSHFKKDNNNLEIRWKEYSIKTKKEVALTPLPEIVLTWPPIQHQVVWEQYINCKSLEEFYNKRSWNQAYLEYALINQPNFDWSKHLSA
jgi:hypothetical protein